MESEEGVCNQSERGVDALTLSFGKKDHRGFVKGLGGCGIGVGYRKAFGPVKGKTMSKSGCSLQELDDMKENLTREFEEKIKEGIATAVKSYFSTFIPHMTGYELQINDAQPSPSSSTNPMELSPRLLEVSTKCRLALIDEFSGNSVIVADGTAEPCPNGVTHNKKMNCDIYRVSVDHVYSDYSHLNLPEETDDGITKLGQAKGYFLGWSADLVFFTDEVMTLAKKTDNELVQSKEKVDSCEPNNSGHSTIKGKGISVSENIVENLGEQCSMLYYCMT